ncbi:hypothetical protein JHK87_049910 [Glycine soja]|nr:hypothetical protein JHK87_049910 [Glycine soja]
MGPPPCGSRRPLAPPAPSVKRRSAHRCRRSRGEGRRGAQRGRRRHRRRRGSGILWILAIKEPAGGLVFEVVGVMKEVLLGVEAVGFGSEADRGEATARRRRGFEVSLALYGVVEATVADWFDGAVKDGSEGEDARCSGLRHCRWGWQWRENQRGVWGVLELDLGIDKSIFIKPRTFHLIVLMLKLWNKDQIKTASEVLQECMKDSLAKARVLYSKRLAEQEQVDKKEPCYHFPDATTAKENGTLPKSCKQLGVPERPLLVGNRMFGRAWPFRAPIKLGLVTLWPQFGSNEACGMCGKLSIVSLYQRVLTQS